jgi:hypothetical protein
MNKIAMVAGLLLIGGLLGFFVNRFALTGNAISDTTQSGNYSWTKAICNSGNECIDAVISCSNGKVVKIEPLLYKVNQGENWTDPRQNLDEFCK